MLLCKTAHHLKNLKQTNKNTPRFHYNYENIITVLEVSRLYSDSQRQIHSTSTQCTLLLYIRVVGVQGMSDTGDNILNVSFSRCHNL